jgi:hypothetical protein
MIIEFEKLLLHGKPYHKTVKQICEEITDLADEGYEEDGALVEVEFPVFELAMLVEYIHKLESKNPQNNVRSIK